MIHSRPFTRRDAGVIFTEHEHFRLLQDVFFKTAGDESMLDEFVMCAMLNSWEESTRKADGDSRGESFERKVQSLSICLQKHVQCVM